MCHCCGPFWVGHQPAYGIGVVEAYNHLSFVRSHFFPAASIQPISKMLFPAVYDLGFRVGQSIYALWHHTAPLPTSSEAVQYIRDFPALYREWWLNLVVKDPLHVAVETTLLVSLLYMVFVRVNEKGYTDSTKDRLTVAEEEELLSEWKDNRAPLAPPTALEDGPPQVVVQFQQGKYLTVTIGDEGELQKVLNFCNFDFLGMQTSKALKEASETALNKYGCGSCGPRGFYGTIDAHLKLEESIANFTQTDGAILYSDGASTCTSTIAAFAKRGDLLVVDEAVYEPLMTGVYLCRANVHWFKHNDMEDLERVLVELQVKDKKLGRAPNAQRRFIIVEGLYKNLGTIAPLDRIVQLKHKYHYRLILDESFSFGTLGKTGRGALEHYNLQPMHDAEIITVALENSVGSIGGVTIGNEEVVDHQRLSGAGYCFSASAPPFTATAAIASINYLAANPGCVRKLQENVAYMYEQLGKTDMTCMVCTSDERSPIVVLQLYKESMYEADITKDIMHECLRRGVAMVATGQDSSSHLRTELAPAIRITISTLHTKQDIDLAIKSLVESSKQVVERYPVDQA
jgi:serine palmitoyltransferase